MRLFEATVFVIVVRALLLQCSFPSLLILEQRTEEREGEGIVGPILPIPSFLMRIEERRLKIRDKWAINLAVM